MIEYLGILIYLLLSAIFMRKALNMPPKLAFFLLYMALLSSLGSNLVLECAPIEMDVISISDFFPAEGFELPSDSSFNSVNESSNLYSLTQVAKMTLAAWVFLKRNQPTVDAIRGVTSGASTIIYQTSEESSPVSGIVELIETACAHDIPRLEAEKAAKGTVSSIAHILRDEVGDTLPQDNQRFLVDTISRLEDALEDLEVSGNELEITFLDHSRRQKITCSDIEMEQIIESLVQDFPFLAL